MDDVTLSAFNLTWAHIDPAAAPTAAAAPQSTLPPSESATLYDASPIHINTFFDNLTFDNFDNFTFDNFDNFTFDNSTPSNDTGNAQVRL